MFDTLLPPVILVGSAVLAGMVNTLAGGGTLLTFPALMNFGRLSAVLANGTSTVALVPGSLAAGWGLRRELGEAAGWLKVLLPPSILGGFIGSLLVTRLPGSVFAALVPWLLLTASLLFLFQPAVARRLRHAETGRPAPGTVAAVTAFQFLVAIYGGYFGAGIGILMLSALGLMGIGDIHRMNALKAILGTVINGTSVIVFATDGKVDWRLAGLMAVGAVAGGYAGARVGKWLPKGLVRWFVIAVGLALAAYYFAKQLG
jgi:hypothetical protein